MQSRQEQLATIRKEIGLYMNDILVADLLQRLTNIVSDIAAELEVAKHMAVTANNKSGLT